jgi:transcriptional regulator with XRE-family HTH domain
LTTYVYGRIFSGVPRKHLTLRAARDAKGWSQEQLEAETARLAAANPDRYTKVDQRNISKIERLGISDPSNSTVLTLETALGLQRGTLVFGAEAEAIAS